MKIILIIFLAYTLQMAICGLINGFLANRIPRGFIDFLKLNFLPWLLFHLKEANED